MFDLRLLDISKLQGEIRMLLIQKYGLNEDQSHQAAADITHQVLLSNVTNNEHRDLYQELQNSQDTTDD